MDKKISEIESYLDMYFSSKMIIPVLEVQELAFHILSAPNETKRLETVMKKFTHMQIFPIRYDKSLWSSL